MNLAFEHVFTAPVGSPLVANTTYWVVAVSDVADQGFFVRATGHGESIAEPGWSIGDSSRSLGSLAQIFPIPKFSIDAAAISSVPEPGAYGSIAAAGLLAFAIWYRRNV